MSTSAWKKENLGPESRKAHSRRVREGFFDRYFGGVVLDIGYRGYEDLDVVPVLEDAIGIDLNYPGYDGKRLPFEDGTVDTVYASHTLEHIPNPVEAIQEWFRVLKVGGHLVLAVPHQFLYEKKAVLPSRWNEDHKRFYTPAKLLLEVESALEPNAYRVRRLLDDDEDYDYGIPPRQHAGGGYQIELVLEKLQKPAWALEGQGDGRAPDAAAAPGGMEELESKLNIVFSDLRASTSMLSAEQFRLADRSEALIGQLGAAGRDRAGAGPEAGGVLEDYIRPDAVSSQDITTTTRFFRNREQMQVLVESLAATRRPRPRVLIVGASRGCEAYSLAIEGELAGLPLDITATDIDAENITAAEEASYAAADFIDFDGTPLMTPDVARFFRREGGRIRVRTEELQARISFEVKDVFCLEGLYDSVICNNVLIHFSDAAVGRALEHLGHLIGVGGVLVVGGGPQEHLSRWMAQRSWFSPIEARMESIWDGWKGDRLSWEKDPGSYVGMPPIDRSLPDWRIRFCTLFRKDHLGFASLVERTPELQAWIRNVRATLGGIQEGQASLASGAETVVGFLDDLMR